MSRKTRNRTSTPFPTDIEPERPGTVQFWGALGAIFLFGLLLTGYYAFYEGIPFADTYTYLDPGRNLLEGRGFVSRFNVVNGWSGRLDHPGLAYYDPLYGIILSVIWRAFGDPRCIAVVAAALPCCINATLLAFLAYRTFGQLTAILSAIGYLLLSSTWESLAKIAAEHPAVTIVLVALLVVQYRIPSESRCWAVAGIVLGFGFLVKVSLLLVVPGFVVAAILTYSGTLGRRRGSVRSAGVLCLGFAGVVLPFTLVCKLLVGEFYPSYPSMAKNWSLATTYGGHYVSQSPAIQPDISQLPSLGKRASFVIDNLQSFSEAAAAELGLLTLTVLLGLINVTAEARRLSIFLLCTGSALAAGHCVSFNWVHTATEPRYVLYLTAFWYPVGVYGIARFVETELKSSLGRGAAATCIWLLASVPTIVGRAFLIAQTAHTPEARVLQLERTMRQCSALVGRDDLVAVAGGGTFIASAVFLDRPVVALPQLAMDNSRAVKEFIEVYHPALIIPSSSKVVPQVLPEMGYQRKWLGPPGNIAVFLRG